MVARETPKLRTSSGTDSPEPRSARTLRACASVSRGGRPVWRPRARAAARAAAARSCISSRSYAANEAKIPPAFAHFGLTLR